MSQHKINPRADFRQQENQRINAAPNLAETFHALKSLSVDLEYYEEGGIRKTAQIKYTVNLTKAKAVFSFPCPSDNCIGGDFDLSEKLASAVDEHLTTATGEICCQGWQSKTTIDSVCCHRVLRYKLNLEY